MTVGKMNTKERARYKEAEGHLAAAFGDGHVRCYWEIIKPTGTNFAVLAGFGVNYNNSVYCVILQVYKNGEGWEVFACPSTLKIAPTFDAIKALWDGARMPNESAREAYHGAKLATHAYANSWARLALEIQNRITGQ